MKRLWVILFVVFIFSCDKSFLTKAELINNYSDFKVLEYKSFKRKSAKVFDINVLYKGEMSEHVIQSILKDLHSKYDELNLLVWIDEEGFIDDKNNVYNGSIDRGLIIYSIKSVSNNLNYIKWMQAIGEFENLFGTKVNF